MTLVTLSIRWWMSAQSVDSASDVVHAAAVTDAFAEATETAESQTQLQSIVANMSSSYGSNIGLVITDLSNGATASSNADTQFVAASIYKLFVAYDIYKKIDAGTLTYTTKLTAYSTSQTVAQCLDAMLTVSNNTCGVALGSLVGWSQLDTLLASEDYVHTVLNNYNASGTIIKDKLTSASDVALLLSRLYAGTLLGSSSTTHFLDLLKADEITYMLPAGLPAGTVVAHKVGYLGQYQHDAGIIYNTSKDMLVVMLTKGWTTPTTEATAAFTTLGSVTWSYMQGV